MNDKTNKQTWVDRALARAKELGLGVTDLNRAVSKNSTTMSDAKRKGAVPSIENFAKIARRLNYTVGELYDGEKSVPETLPLYGSVRGKEMWQVLARNDKKEVPLSFFDKDLIAIQVDTAEMQPSYRMGDVLIGTKMIGRHLDNLIGRDCICETLEGERYVKFLARGVKPGTFNLRSPDPSVKDVEDVKLAWAAPIEMILRSPL